MNEFGILTTWWS